MKYTNSYGVTVNFTPWFDSGYRFTKLHMYEEIGGALSGGSISLEYDGSPEALELITTQYTGTIEIEQEGGNIYSVPVFITSRNFFKNFMTLEFVCISDKKFFTELVSTEWTDIGGAIQSLYPGKQDIRCESDINNGVKIFQNGETNYSMCTKLAYSFKHGTIFAYGFDGLLIKELIGKDSGGNQEPFWEIIGEQEVHQVDSYATVYDKRLYYKPLNPWENDPNTDYSTGMALGNRAMLFYSNYSIVGTDYYQLLDNYYYNKRYMDSNMFTSFRVVDLKIPGYRIGDVLKYTRGEEETKLPFDTFLVRSNELFIAIEGSDVVDENGLSFSWTSKFMGIQENGEILPETDPTNSEV